MKCAACNLPVADADALRVDRASGEFFIHRPGVDGRCFSKAVMGRGVDVIALFIETATRTKAARPAPYRCPKCKGESFYGKLLFDGDEVPLCPNEHLVLENEVLTKYDVRLVPSE